MNPLGCWDDRQATFTLYAGALYYPYEFLNRVLPLDALTDYLQAMGGEEAVSYAPSSVWLSGMA